MYGPDSYNLATQTKWLLEFPVKFVDKSISNDDLKFNLYHYSMPEFTIKGNDVFLKGYPINVPTNVRGEVKNITFTYILSSDWSQYRFLYSWYKKTLREIPQTGIRTTASYPLVDCSVTILSEFKKPIFRIKYYGCWLSFIARLDMSYQTVDDKALKHSFSMNYAYHDLEDLISTGEE